MFVVQGKYTDRYGWEDLTAHETRAKADEECALYDREEQGVPHRVVERKEEEQ